MERAKPFIPSGPQRGSDVQYDALRAAWADLLPGLPRIDGWTITEPLPDIDDMGQAFIDYLDIGVHPTAVHAAGEKPGADLAAYRYRLDRLVDVPHGVDLSNSSPWSTQRSPLLWRHSTRRR